MTVVIAWELKSGAHCIENRPDGDLATRIEGLYKNSRVKSAEAWRVGARHEIIGEVWVNNGKRTWWSL